MPYKFNIAALDIIEAVLALLLVAFALFRPRPTRELFAATNRLLRPLTRRPAMLVAVATVAPIGLRLALLAVDPAPTPHLMEEFSHILQADTYAHGRLANPVHPLAVLLQGYQIVQWPHYVSARTPLSSVFLAVGQWLFGSPFLGNLLSVGAVAGALCWMLLGFVERRWAALGSLLIVLVDCLFGSWVNSYLCVTPILLGAALATGLVPRIERAPRFGQAPALVVAIALLLGTRPYEGALLLVTLGSWLAVRFLQPPRRALIGRALLRVALPTAIGCVAIVAAQLAFDRATTGVATLMPYQIWRAAQTYVPSFLWQPIVRPALVFYHPGAAIFAEWEAEVAAPGRPVTPFGWLLLLGRHGVTLRDQLGPMLFLPLLCWSPHWIARWRIARGPITRSRGALLLVWAMLVMVLAVAWLVAGDILQLLLVAVLIARWHDVRQQLPVVVVLVGLIGTSLSSFYMTIYFLAFLPALLIVTMAGLRDLARWGGRRGTALAGAVVAGCLAMPLVETIAYAAGRPSYGVFFSRFDPHPFRQRLTVEHALAGRRGRLLVMVRVVGTEEASNDLVWNGAAIDDQRIVWARDLRPDWTAAAIRYYPDRSVWLVTIRSIDLPPIVTPYPRDRLPPPPLSALPMPDRETARALGAH